MAKDHCFVAPVGIADPAPLGSSRRPLDDANPVIKGASPLTLRISRVCLLEDKEPWWAGDNEFVVAAEHRFGSQQPVTTIHVADPDARVPFDRGDLAAPVVCTTDDYGGGDLHVRLSAIEVDALDQDDVKALGDVISTAGTIFLATSPYIPVIAAGAQLAAKLFDCWNWNDEILGKNQEVTLTSKLGTNMRLLQKARYVVFRKPVDRKGLTLDEGSHVCKADGSPFTACSYLVFTVLDSCADAAAFDVTQAGASKLLRQIDDPHKGKTWGYLKETMQLYYVGKRLKRRHELLEKDEGDLSTEETALLKRITNDPKVAPYIG